VHPYLPFFVHCKFPLTNPNLIMKLISIASSLLLTLIFIPVSVHCQEIGIPQGWTLIEISELGSIGIPPTIELRDDDSFVALLTDEFRNSLISRKKIEIIKPQLTLQPKGTTKLNKDAVSKYSRILITVDKGDQGEFLSNREVLALTKSELDQLNSMYRQSFEADAKKLGEGKLKLLDWETISVVKINDMAAIRIAYMRQAMSNPPVYVQTYNFLNYDERIEITLSYRDNEKYLWAEDFETSINSFRYFKKR
ncbi:MAG TPA: hypothetical protein PK246_10580, partial [Saprospiraceae bacterium]|nr:hypothetical protein [Saprospiraceae bacterium]